MSSTLQAQTQALDNILYKLRCYKDPQRIRRDALECISRYPSLLPQTAVPPSAAPNGTAVLRLAGTVPITYSGANYNIPVVVWLTESYPFGPPSVYVTPTADMVIKPRHKHVDSQGVVYLPYISSWNANTCNIISMVEVIIVVFSQDPPVRSTPPGHARPPVSSYPYAQPYQHKQSNSGNGYAGPQNAPNASYLGNNYPPSGNLNNSYPNYPTYNNPGTVTTPVQPSVAGSFGSVLPQGYGSYPPGNIAPNYPQDNKNPPYNGHNSYSNASPYPNSQGSYHPGNMTNSQGNFAGNQPVYNQSNSSYPTNGSQGLNYYAGSSPPPTKSESGNKRDTLDKLTMKTQGRLHEFYSQTTKEIDSLMLGSEEDTSGFEQRRRAHFDKMNEMDNEINTLSKRFEEVDKWLVANEHTQGIDIDVITEPQDSLTRQLLDHVAEDSALEDLMYNMEKSLHRGTIDIDTCLKQLRLLAADQCNKRAMIKKIHEVRRNAPPGGR